MSDYSEFFLNSAASIVELECFEISHSSFSRTYYFVRNAVDGVTVIHEDATSHDYQYYPAAVTPVGVDDDLDQIMKISLGDLGEVLPLERDRISDDDTFNEKPAVKFRVYRSDDLTGLMMGPLTLEVGNIVYNQEGSILHVRAPRLNINRTGEIYSLDRFPMLRGFV